MTDGTLAISPRLILRNDLGRFIREVEVAGETLASKLVERGASLSRAMAPVGHKHDRRTIPLRDSIGHEMYSRTAGSWFATARHAMAQEKGGRPHIITGDPHLSFYWEAARRRWIPADEFYHQPGLVDVVNHPGNPAQPYLRPAYEIVLREAMTVAREVYP